MELRIITIDSGRFIVHVLWVTLFTLYVYLGRICRIQRQVGISSLLHVAPSPPTTLQFYSMVIIWAAAAMTPSYGKPQIPMALLSISKHLSLFSFQSLCCISVIHRRSTLCPTFGYVALSAIRDHLDRCGCRRIKKPYGSPPDGRPISPFCETHQTTSWTSSCWTKN